MKSKLMLTLGLLPLLLAGCGNNDGQFSSHPNNVARVVAKSKQEAQKNSIANSSSLQNAKYQPISNQLIKRALNKNQITVAKAQIANQKLSFKGQVKAIGKANDGDRTILVASKNQSYVVFAKTSLVKQLKVDDQVTVYGSGLAMLTSSHQTLGIDAGLMNSNTLMFNADQFANN